MYGFNSRKYKTCEPRHDKTNKKNVRPAKTQISLGILPVWSESSLSAWRTFGALATHWAQAKTLIRLGGRLGWSESSLGAYSFCWFCHVAAHIRTISDQYNCFLKLRSNNFIHFAWISAMNVHCGWPSYRLCHLLHKRDNISSRKKAKFLNQASWILMLSISFIDAFAIHTPLLLPSFVFLLGILF